MIDVCFIDVTAPADLIEALAESLADTERTRADRYRFPDDRRRSIVARAAVRRLLGSYLNAEPRGLVFIEEEHGKPALVNREIEFNVSHSGDLVALAFARGTAVGIDVERRRRLNDSLALARRYFSAQELAFVNSAADVEDAFFTIWTAKEAIVKASGEGIASSDLRGFTVPFGEQEMKPVIGGWIVATVDPPLKGYYSAVAAQAGAGREVISRIIAPAALL